MAGVPAQYRGWVSTAARATGLPAGVVAAQINLESGFNPKAVSPAGAQGIAQFMPGTWASNAPRGSSPFDPSASLGAYSKLMGTLLHQYGGNVQHALAAYNAGPGNLGAGMGYARQVMSAASQFGGLGSGGGGAIPQAPSAGSAASSYGLKTTQKFDQAGYDAARRSFLVGRLASQGNPFDIGPKGPDPGSNLLFSTGLLTTTEPNKNDYMSAQTTLQKLAGDTALHQHPGTMTDRGVSGSRPGNVEFAPQARIGVQPITIDTLSQASAGIGHPLYVGTGKVGHSLMTVNGNVSEHSTGHAGDLIASQSGMSNEALGQSLYRYFTGSKSAPAGGLFNIPWHGHRIQLIYQTMEGGNHYTHVHVGVQ